MAQPNRSTGTSIDRDDVQGILFSAYSHLPCAGYMLLQIDDPAKAKTWLNEVAGKVTNARKLPRDQRPVRNMNVALTYTALQKLGVPDEVLLTFSFPFIDGMHSKRRARILGDTDENAPASWRWGNAANPVDVILMLYTVEEQIQPFEDEQSAIANGSGLRVLQILRAGRQPDTKEHFGFNDGVGQPVIADTEQHNRQLARTQHVTPLPPGEFVMSYEDAYGNIPPGPAVDPSRDPRNLLLPTAEGKARDLGRNGSYMVFRQLAQDVAAFWRFCEQVTQNADGTTTFDATDRMGAKFVGRWRSGTPLVGAPDRDPWTKPHELNTFNDFDYSSDPHGYQCPIGAHIRRSNPRDSLDPDQALALMTANRHRILRRGRSYGDRLSTTDPHPKVDDGKERGLNFICFNTDLQRQFEFVQQTWINNPQFGGLHDEVDPLIGDQQSCAGIMTVQADPLRVRVKNMCRFVTMRGGAYAFLPGIRALRWIASV